MRDAAITSRIMASVKSKDTGPELLLRRALHHRGLRYRLHAKGLPGRPDIVFPRARLAVFVDGDFWHGQGWRERGFTSFEEQFSRHRDPERWRSKIQRNMARDDEVNVALTSLGWRVLRVWESDIRRDLGSVVDTVEGAVRAPSG